MLGYLLLNYAFRFLEASRVAVFVNLTPVVAVAAAYALLDERFGVWQGVPRRRRRRGGCHVWLGAMRSRPGLEAAGGMASRPAEALAASSARRRPRSRSAR